MCGWEGLIQTQPKISNCHVVFSSRILKKRDMSSFTVGQQVLQDVLNENKMCTPCTYQGNKNKQQKTMKQK